jgi:broad specificity phosphatase PhoE
MSDYTTICTVRHAQTKYGVQKRYAGTIDVPLNNTGVEDTKHASKKLNGMRFDVIITSTLERAVQTARHLLGDDGMFIKCAYCNERNYGTMQGLTEDEVKLIEPKVEFLKVGNDYHSLNPPHGETFEMLRKRAQKLHQLIFEKYRGLSVLVVSHGAFLQQFHGLIRGLDWKMSLATGLVRPLELTRFHFRGNLLVSNSAIKLVERNQDNW